MLSLRTGPAFTLAVVVVGTIGFFEGILFAGIFPSLNREALKLLIDSLVAVGTIGAVIAAVAATSVARHESASRARREAAEKLLHQAVENFLAKADDQGRPINTRQHWLNFARGIVVSRRIASGIVFEEQREIWRENEHVLRVRVWDVLKPIFESYPAEYYGDPEYYKRRGPLPIAEQSLVVVYRWVDWPPDLPDPIDRSSRFTEEELERMASIGPRGVARYIDRRRPPKEPRPVHVGSDSKSEPD